METKPNNPLKRRSVLAGAGAVGVVGVLAAASSQPDSTATPEQTAQARHEPNGGYQLTEHVKRYYATART